MHNNVHIFVEPDSDDRVKSQTSATRAQMWRSESLHLLHTVLSSYGPATTWEPVCE